MNILDIIILIIGISAILMSSNKQEEAKKELQWYKEENERLKAEIESLKTHQ